MTLRKRLSRYLSERISFHFYSGEGLREWKIRIGTTHFRVSRWQYQGKPATWSCRRFRPYISATLVGDESWLTLLSRIKVEETA